MSHEPEGTHVHALWPLTLCLFVC